MNVPAANPSSVRGNFQKAADDTGHPWATHQPVQCGRQEFRVIDDATAISIHVLEPRGKSHDTTWGAVKSWWSTTFV